MRRYSRSFGLSASVASPPCGEWKSLLRHRSDRPYLEFVCCRQRKERRSIGLLLFAFGQWQGSGNSKNAIALRSLINARSRSQVPAIKARADRKAVTQRVRYALENPSPVAAHLEYPMLLELAQRLRSPLRFRP